MDKNEIIMMILVKKMNSLYNEKLKLLKWQNKDICKNKATCKNKISKNGADEFS